MALTPPCRRAQMFFWGVEVQIDEDIVIDPYEA